MNERNFLCVCVSNGGEHMVCFCFHFPRSSNRICDNNTLQVMWNEDTTEIINDMGTIIYFLGNAKCSIYMHNHISIQVF